MGEEVEVLGLTQVHMKSNMYYNVMLMSVLLYVIWFCISLSVYRVDL